MQVVKFQLMFCEQRKPCPKFSLDLVVPDQHLECEDSEVSWVRRNLQYYIQALLDAYCLCKCTDGQDRYKPGLRIAQSS